MNADDAARKTREGSDQRREPWAETTASPVPGRADLMARRRLEKSLSWTRRERLRGVWYRLRLTVAEMNYATRRMVELRASWISDDRPH
jgi:hypothetical protein